MPLSACVIRCRRVAIVLISVLFLTACAPTSITPTPAAALPTLFPTPTGELFPLENAERTAEIFLSGWREQDYEVMHRMLTFASRDATPFDAFVALYETNHTTMTLERLSYRPVTLARDEQNPRFAYYTYDVTFQTRLVGDFTDAGRTLRLVFDDRAGDWRVAWTPGDIFAELDRGGELRLLTTQPNRANIYDRNGLVLAAQEERLVITVQTVRREISDPEACISVLTQTTGLPESIVRARFMIGAPDWTNEIGTMEAQAYIEYEDQLLNICRATFGNRPGRYYPNGTLFAHILGNVGYPDEADVPALVAQGFNQDSIVGKSGVERSWDETLRGKPGTRLVIQTPGVAQPRLIATRDPQVAESVWLTVDTDLQTFISELIARAYANNSAGWARTSRGASAIVMDVNTGEILAMVSYPTFDANAFTPFPSIGRSAATQIVTATQADERRPLLNRASQGVYPTGSVMKIATAIAVANSGVYTVDRRFTCFGNGTFNRDIPRRDWLASGHGVMNLAGAITMSCNPYFYEAGYQMDITDPWLMPNALMELGLGQPTGMTDIEEARGNIGTPDWKRRNRGLAWTFSDAVDMAIGQGMVEITPLQVTRLVAAVANGGTFYQPRLVKKAGLLNEFSVITEPTVTHVVDIAPDVLDAVRLGMCDVTARAFAGTAEFVFAFSPLQDRIGVCGKTGTAEDTPRVSHAWFTAYAPRDNPQIAITVVVENSGEGSGVAAPLVRDILEYYFFGEDFPN